MKISAAVRDGIGAPEKAPDLLMMADSLRGSL